ncbi:protein-glutamate methylesterase/protein-glutamine glutaminase [Paenibacillus sp. SYP-B4298]|uniref:protein-glutamate methylesterase/protein-glutamine glutaminase n=1 Tax=Paenibacillus sp. SYP-B4298 TaxID=2996034 RepID=UPI0022DE3B5C|nr:chemotaxis response regulator protein-glutamate methylesterase [Paenibacillus sp. SYP-B4298]
MPITVLIVDDSSFMRRMIAKIVDADPNLKVVGTAADGMEAIRQIKALRPQVVTLDVEMPVLGGLDALKEIMRDCPVPVVMLSSLTESGAMETIKALQYGAVDFIHKPSGALSIDLIKIQQEIQDTIKAASKVDVGRLRSALLRQPGQLSKERQHSMKPQPTRAGVSQIVAIGASTGGPQALTKILSELGGAFRHPVVIAQHMPPSFTASLAARLNLLSPLHVSEAVHDEWLENGRVYIAPGDYHLNVVPVQGGYKIRLHQRENGSRHRPSVDELFASVAALHSLKRHFVLLTGMGRDGAAAMGEAKASGAAATTIAEAKDTCVVYGMPRAAIEAGDVDKIVPLPAIAGAIMRACQ